MKDLSIYIHIPFCRSKCSYCGFLSFANKSEWIASYIKALKKELTLKSKKFKKHAIVCIYFGGGTPSLIESKFIEQIIYSIRQNFKVKSDAEITIECNPESVTSAKIKHYKKTGINRFSLGVQSLNNKTLARIGRAHNSKQVFQTLKIFKTENIKNLALDFIIGLPFQTLPSFKKDVAKILSYNPPHLSYYFLSQDTPYIKNYINECPDEETQIKMYNHLTSTLKKAGYIHYEVSNYAKHGFECRHNLRYWNQREYLGLGLGAHSYINGTVSENEINLDKYIKNPVLIHDSYKLEPDVKRMDLIMLNMRTRTGINLNEYTKKYGQAAKKSLLTTASPFIKNKNLILGKNILYATEKGWLTLNVITKALL
jgi:oxygen-independent coproporphyrinogen III oxidase